MQVGGLDAELDWSSVLSAGEQQRLAIARVLLAASIWPGTHAHARGAHALVGGAAAQGDAAAAAAVAERTSGGASQEQQQHGDGGVVARGGLSVAFLDEATSALDGPTEGRLYALLR